MEIVDSDGSEAPEGHVPTAWTGTNNFWFSRTEDGLGLRVVWSVGRPDGKRCRLDVCFDDKDPGTVTSVTLERPDGLTPSKLSRFPWARFLAMADAAERSFSSAAPLWDETPESRRLEQLVRATMEGRPLPKASIGSRPGRRGHAETHYGGVARRYLELRRRGVTNPTARIAEESSVNRSTAAGWVRGARRRGYLPPARPGRAG